MKIKYLLAILSMFLSKTTLAAKDKESVTVLPITSSILSEDTRLYLTDQFRQYLRDTDSFTVMTRDLMKEILNEQEFQMSELCDQTSCMVQVGKLVGAQAIVSVIIIENKKRCYSATCKLISVENGEITAQATETRTGEKIATIERMLRNIAGAIAGKPTEDHLEFLSQLDNISKKQLQRFKMTLYTQGSLPMRFITGNSNIPRHNYYDEDSTIREWGLPEKEFNYGFGLGFSMKLNEKIWLKSQLSLDWSNESREFIVWDETLGNADLHHTSHTGINHMVFDLSLGLETVLFKNTHFQFTVITMPLAGYGRKWLYSTDTIIVKIKNTSKNEYTGQTTEYLFQNSQTVVDGFITGGDIGVTGSFNFRKNWSFDISLNTRCIIAPELQGDTRVSQRAVTFSLLHPNGTVSDSTYSYRAAAVKGNFLGTGEYITIRNPDEKTAVPYRKSIYEFSALALRIGFSYYF
ncbi:MAG: hypothetical protein JW915_24725 [Chitinispirillaceae bacterium]|nr:hypothetical protein [Chitinispirillaceae bacterium]